MIGTMKTRLHCPDCRHPLRVITTRQEDQFCDACHLAITVDQEEGLVHTLRIGPEGTPCWEVMPLGRLARTGPL